MSGAANWVSFKVLTGVGNLLLGFLIRAFFKGIYLLQYMIIIKAAQLSAVLQCKRTFCETLRGATCVWYVHFFFDLT